LIAEVGEYSPEQDADEHRQPDPEREQTIEGRQPLDRGGDGVRFGGCDLVLAHCAPLSSQRTSSTDDEYI